MARLHQFYPAGATIEGEPLVLYTETQSFLEAYRGATGLEAPPWTIVSEDQPGMSGGRFAKAVVRQRSFVTPMLINATDRVHLRTIKRELMQVLNPERGPGIFEIQEDVGTDHGARRFLNAVYEAGLEGDDSEAGLDDNLWFFTLTFRALDPWWYGSVPALLTWDGLQGTPFYPLLPLTINPSGVVISEFAEIDGDREAYPEWEVDGPFTRVRVANARSGKFWELDRPTVEGETLRLVTKPGYQQLVETGSGVSVWSSLDLAGSTLWSVEPGDETNLVLSVDGTSSVTQVRMSVNPCFISAP